MEEQPKRLQRFAAMSPERRLEISRKGGASVPAHKRSFAMNHELAAAAGSKGGWAVRKPRST